MRANNLTGGFFWFFLGIFISIWSFKMKIGSIRQPGPGFMPLLTGTFLGLLGLILIFHPVSNGIVNGEGTKKKIFLEIKSLRKFLLTLLASFGYILMLKPFGFILTTFIFLLFLFKLTEPKRWLMPLIIDGLIVVASYIVFCIWLQCQFPKGLLGF